MLPIRLWRCLSIQAQTSRFDKQLPVRCQLIQFDLVVGCGFSGIGVFVIGMTGAQISSILWFARCSSQKFQSFKPGRITIESGTS
jgi:hypothetical protein